MRGDGRLDQEVPQGEREEDELLEKFGRYHHTGLGCELEWRVRESQE